MFNNVNKTPFIQCKFKNTKNIQYDLNNTKLLTIST